MLAVSAVVVAAAVVATVAASAGDDPEARIKAVVVGDSLSFQASPEIQEAAADAGIDIEVDAVPGSSVAQRVADVTAAAARRPDVLVVALGTNDVYYAIPGPRAAVRRVLAAARPAGCVVWVLVGEVLGRSAAPFNRLVMSAAASDDTVDVLRWDRTSAGHDAWIDSDGIHHSVSGRSAFAAAIADGIRSCGERR